MFTSWLASASAAGFGAFFGALGAYWLACRKEDARRKAQYHCLLLLVYERLELLYKGLTAFTDADVVESASVKTVTLDTPFPSLGITSEQMQTLFEVSPDKQMPSTLLHVENFVKSHQQRFDKQGYDVLPVEFITHQARQLQLMLLSVRVQFEQSANVTFPLYESANTSPQK